MSALFQAMLKAKVIGVDDIERVARKEKLAKEEAKKAKAEEAKAKAKETEERYWQSEMARQKRAILGRARHIISSHFEKKVGRSKDCVGKAVALRFIDDMTEHEVRKLECGLDGLNQKELDALSDGLINGRFCIGCLNISAVEELHNCQRSDGVTDAKQ